MGEGRRDDEEATRLAKNRADRIIISVVLTGVFSQAGEAKVIAREECGWCQGKKIERRVREKVVVKKCSAKRMGVPIPPGA
jgi:hypothetical protein